MRSTVEGVGGTFDQLHHADDIAEDVTRGNPQRRNALLLQPSVALGIAPWLVAAIMRLAVNFNREAGRLAVEVERVRSGGMLAAEF